MKEGQARLELRIDVTYDLNGSTKEDMKDLLEHIASNAIGNGMLTGDTPAEADEWKARVHDVSDRDTSPPSVPRPNAPMLFSDRMHLEKAFCQWAGTNGIAQTPMNVAAFIDIHPEWLERFTMIKKMRARQKEVMDRNVEADAELSDHDRIEVERCRREVAEEEYAKLKKQLEEPDPNYAHQEQKSFEEKFDRMIRTIIENEGKPNRFMMEEFLGKMSSAFSAFIGSIVMKYKAKLLSMGPLRLKTEGENDFILDGADEVWIEIDNIVVYVRKTEDAVTVDLTPKVSAHETLDCCNADFGMAKEFECTKCGQYNNDGDGFNGLCASCADKAEEDGSAEEEKEEGLE